MDTRARLSAALEPLARRVAAMDLEDPAAARAALDAEDYPLQEIDALLHAASEEGWLTPRRASETLTFGRLAKATPATADCVIDVVDMEGPGLAHVHPRGEVDLCFPRAGTPTFEGCSHGFVVMPPQSRHTPTVTGGRMVIVYFLPGGAITFDPT